MEYPKIDTLFERDENFRVDTSRLRHPVFGTIKEWDVTEKIDGMNIRVEYNPSSEGYLEQHGLAEPSLGSVRFYGRTNAAKLPGDLVTYLHNTFPAEKFAAKFQTPVILYGEGYGAGIQKGGAYRPDKSFILFDVLVDGKWWLNDTQMRDVAQAMGVDAVPYLGRMHLNDILNHVLCPFDSKIGTATAEGVVARPIETLFDKRHERVILKLKTRDFQGGR